jgi:hypothetical protein
MGHLASGRRPGAVSAALLCYLAWGTRAANAAPGVVVVLEPSTTSTGAHRCLTRIREELLAGGFEVAVIDPGPRADPASVAEYIQRQPDSAATIALLGDPTLGPAELWILDRTGARTDVRRIAAPTDDPSHVAEVLAIRSIELLRASTLQKLVESNRPRSSEIATVGARNRSRVGIELGITVVDDVNGPGPAAIPVARLHLLALRSTFLRLTAEGLGSRPRIQTAAGSATIGQNLGLVEVGTAFRRDRHVMPIVTLGAGVLYVTSDGDGIYPYTSHQDSRWAAIVDCGVGLMGTVSNHWSSILEVHAFLAAPYPTVRFSGIDAGTIGRPALAAAFTLVTWL